MAHHTQRATAQHSTAARQDTPGVGKWHIADLTGCTRKHTGPCPSRPTVTRHSNTAWTPLSLLPQHEPLCCIHNPLSPQCSLLPVVRAVLLPAVVGSAKVHNPPPPPHTHTHPAGTESTHIRLCPTLRHLTITLHDKQAHAPLCSTHSGLPPCLAPPPHTHTHTLHPTQRHTQVDNLTCSACRAAASSGGSIQGP
jgi:hypothetical protein